jgi:hypothetical protein
MPDSFTIYHLRFTAQVETTIELNAFKGSALRGAWQSHLRTLYCAQTDNRDPLHQAMCPVCFLLSRETGSGDDRCHAPRSTATFNDPRWRILKAVATIIARSGTRRVKMSITDSGRNRIVFWLSGESLRSVIRWQQEADLQVIRHQIESRGHALIIRPGEPPFFGRLSEMPKPGEVVPWYGVTCSAYVFTFRPGEDGCRLKAENKRNRRV